MSSTLRTLKNSALAAASMVSLMPTMVLAQNNIKDQLEQTGNAAYGVDGTTELPVLIGTYINAFLGLLGIFFVIYIIIVGFKLFTSSEPKAISEATGQIKNLVIGLIIIFAAYAISNFVIDAVTANI